MSFECMYDCARSPNLFDGIVQIFKAYKQGNDRIFNKKNIKFRFNSGTKHVTKIIYMTDVHITSATVYIV